MNQKTDGIYSCNTCDKKLFTVRAILKHLFEGYGLKLSWHEDEKIIRKFIQEEAIF
jgi:hypothetical protein